MSFPLPAEHPLSWEWRTSWEYDVPQVLEVSSDHLDWRVVLDSWPTDVYPTASRRSLSKRLIYVNRPHHASHPHQRRAMLLGEALQIGILVYQHDPGQLFQRWLTMAGRLRKEGDVWTAPAVLNLVNRFVDMEMTFISGQILNDDPEP